MNNHEELITIIDDEGKETLFHIVMTFRLDEYNKDYVCVTPVGDEDGEEEEADLFVFSFSPDASGENGSLQEIEDDKEWAACDAVIQEFLEAEELDEL